MHSAAVLELSTVARRFPYSQNTSLSILSLFSGLWIGIRVFDILGFHADMVFGMDHSYCFLNLLLRLALFIATYDTFASSTPCFIFLV
jgi:hypothetical protein